MKAAIAFSVSQTPAMCSSHLQRAHLRCPACQLPAKLKDGLHVYSCGCDYR